jgi:GT2 family glycosyltransferase
VNDVLPVSVIIPTVGRPRLLQAALESIAACVPRAAEMIVVDQSEGDEVRVVVDRFAPLGVRVVNLSARNKPLALNVGLEQAENEVVLVTDDDCTVAPSWIEAAWRQMQADPTAIVTGRVLPAGEPRAVPSTIEETTRRDYTGEIHYGALYGGNMACNRSLILAAGGFDERLPIAEDNDFCYRWLRAGRPLRYEPDLLVWHHAWRTPPEMDRLLRSYGHGQGLFYAKHLRQHDFAVVRFLFRDVYRGTRGAVAALMRGGEWSDPRKGLLSDLLLGLVEGWRLFALDSTEVPAPPRRTSGETP